MRNVAFLGFGVLLLIVQANLYRLIDRLPIPGVAPSLLLPLIVFMGVHEYSRVRGASIAFVLGYVLDIFAGAPVGLFTCVSVSVFLLSRAAGVRLAAQTVITQAALAFGFSLLESVLLLSVLAIFGKNPYSPRALVAIVVPHGVATALLSPLVFRLAERLHQATITVPRPDAGGAA